MSIVQWDGWNIYSKILLFAKPKNACNNINVERERERAMCRVGDTFFYFDAKLKRNLFKPNPSN